MRLKIKALLVIVILFFSGPAFADLYFEPYLGYHQTTNDFNAGGTVGDYSGSASGMGYGVRLGGTYYSFQFGLDYSLAPGSWQSDSSSVSVTDATIRADNIGLFVGYRATTDFRFYLSYYFHSVIDYSPDGGANQSIIFNGNTSTYRDGPFFGDGFKLGVGYYINSYIVVNLDYAFMEYDTFGSIDLGGANVLYKTGGLMLSLSFPFSFVGTTSFGDDFGGGDYQSF